MRQPASEAADFDRFGLSGVMQMSFRETPAYLAALRRYRAGVQEAGVTATCTEGNGRSRAGRPTVAGALTHCVAMLIRAETSAKPRQFLIGGAIGLSLAVHKAGLFSFLHSNRRYLAPFYRSYDAVLTRG